MAISMYPAFGALDWVVVTYIHPGRLWWFWSWRGLGVLLILVS